MKQEHLGTIGRVLEQAGNRYRYLEVFRGEPVPEDPGGLSGLIVMGGPMGVYEQDKYPFLSREIRLIEKAIGSGVPVLGICLGAQMIASALGAHVYPGHRKEIGWYPVETTAPQEEWIAGLPASFPAFHWHGDTFDLPSGAVRLFRSRLYENQGFRYGERVCAIQFHFEITAAMVAEWLEDPGCRAELAALPDVSPETIRQETEKWGGGLEELSGKVFGKVLGIGSSRRIGD